MKFLPVAFTAIYPPDLRRSSSISLVMFFFLAVEPRGPRAAKTISLLKLSMGNGGDGKQPQECSLICRRRRESVVISTLAEDKRSELRVAGRARSHCCDKV